MSAIHINPSHEGLLHEEMGVPKGKKIRLSDLMKKLRRDKANDDVAGEKCDVFAINAKTKFHHS